MNNAIFSVPKPYNEPIYDYLKGSPERKSLKDELHRQSGTILDIPLVINGEKITSGKVAQVYMPHNHKHKLADYYIAGKTELNKAIESALNAKDEWQSMPFEHRAAIFLKAADLISGKWRYKLNAATMLGQSKTVVQAEIDSACEIADFLRFNVAFAEEIYQNQPNSSPGCWNRMEYRPLSGFVVAISPFNFTAIGGNLPSAPALMGNTVIWKPASTAVLSNYMLMQIFMEAGLPDGVINFVPCSGSNASKYLLSHPKLAGFHFTGSTGVFSSVWSNIGSNINRYESYPRLVGETGGKDFIFADKSAEIEPLVAAMVRGAFEYQGQKCSAASRAYIPKSLWGEVEPKLLKQVNSIKIGDISDFSNFMGAVIDKSAFDSIKEYIDYAKNSSDADVLIGGYDDSVGWFIKPTVILAHKPNFKTMTEEIFGPVLTVFVYDDDKLEETVELCNNSSPYALTGAIFAKDRNVIVRLEKDLFDSAGNFYINDKPTGAVVGQQPFGGARGSGTNDKAGSVLNLYRWVSPRTIKETFFPSHVVSYPYMED